MSLPKQNLNYPFTNQIDVKRNSIRQDFNHVSTKLVDSEALLRQMILKNPEQGFELIYKRYYNPLCSHSLRYVYATNVAEDIVSEVFLAFWRKELYRTVKTTFKAFLYTAVRNRSFNYIKAQFGSGSTHGTQDVENIETHDLNDPHSIMMLNELMAKISHAINSFPPQCQRVFLLSRVEGKKNREIADILNISIKTVEAHMMKALVVLRLNLNEYL